MITIRQLIEVVKEAGTAAMEFYDDPDVYYKKDDSPLTKADLASEKVLLDRLKEFGDFGFLSEESADDKSRLDKEYTWIIDPLDGTMDFIQKTGEFSVMVGLVKGGLPVMGVVYQPSIEKIYFAEKSKGAFVRIGQGAEIKLRVSQVSDLKEARLVVSRNHLSKRDSSVAIDMGLGNYVQAGSNGVKMCFIAQGNAELFFNSWTGFGEWDSCGPDLILRESGGVVTGMDGKPLKYNKEVPKSDRGIVASNGLLHDDIINNFAKRK
ncbi:MAG: 3'(2'),5'-bisphosphate nucleotidase CysQ [Patescibacteria group bacterium]|nr:3'(2'),5'-bisphosphate nucleotidase CysQ [Patescibacteria group bacterium]